MSIFWNIQIASVQPYLNPVNGCVLLSFLPVTEEFEKRFITFQATMLKKRKHKIKRRNTEPSVNQPLSLNQPVQATLSSTGVAADGASTGGLCDETIVEHPQMYPNLADTCDSPEHATAV